MFAKKIQAFTQVVGCVTIGLLAVYGLVTLAGGAPALATAAESLGLKAAEAPVIPSTFNYQGLLRNPDGSLMTGAYTITAQVYDVATAGSALYTETFPNVTVRDGLFNIVLGDDPGSQNLQSVFSATPRYIGITLVGQGDELIPRQRLHGVPWALYATNAADADLLDGQDANTLVPPGTVVAYAGSTPPPGWLLCDGREVTRTLYPALFAAITTTYGSVSTTASFRLPDYRGYFLRGVDGGAGRDPDVISRTAIITGGNTGGAVGSVQGDEFKAHTHSYTTRNSWHQRQYNPQYEWFWADESTADTGSAGGAETRPVNAYVNWIIKY